MRRGMEMRAASGGGGAWGLLWDRGARASDGAKELRGPMASMPSEDRAQPADRPLLVLGATGRLGCMLARQWRADAQAPALRQARRATPGHVTCDFLNDPAALDRLIAETRPAALVSLAGQTGAAAAEDAVPLARVLLKAAARADLPLLLPSSAAVYGNARGSLTEDTDPTPISDYGRAKAQMEEVAQAHRIQGTRVTCLRIANVAGADAILGGWREGFPLDQLPGGGGPTRSYMGPATFARLIAHLARMPDLPPILNLSAPGAHGMDALLAAAGLPFMWSDRAPAVPHVKLDTQRLEVLTSFTEAETTAPGIVAQWREDQRLSKDETVP